MPSETPIPSEITRLLHRWKAGDREALASLASLAYEDLHAIASGYLRREDPGHTLQATARPWPAWPRSPTRIFTPSHRDTSVAKIQATRCRPLGW